MGETTDEAKPLLAAAAHAYDIARAQAWERIQAAQTESRARTGQANQAIFKAFAVTESQVRAFPEVQAILNASAELRRQCFILASQDENTPFKLLLAIAHETDGLTAGDLTLLLPAMATIASNLWGSADPRLKAQADLVEDAWGRLDEEDRERLAPEVARVAVAAAEHMPDVMTRLRRLLDVGQVPTGLIFEADNVGIALRAVITADREPDAARGRLIRLLAEFPTAGKPGEQWTADARNVASQFGDSPGLIGALLDAAIDAEDFEAEQRYGGWVVPAYVTKANEPVVCGLALLAGQVAGAGAADLLPRLRALALKAITMIGPFSESRSIRLATNCVAAIEDAALPGSVTELLCAERSTRHGTLLRQVRASVDALAAAQGLGRDELLERSVEDHGLAADGTRRVALADGWTAVLSADARTAAVEYADSDGKPRKSLPAPVKRASAAVLSTLTGDLKAVRATVGNERSRIEGLLASGRPLGPEMWGELYLDHPVTGRLARALIWTFTPAGGEPVAGIPVGGPELLLCDGAASEIPADAEVTLWHPATADAAEVAAWRRLLLDREIAQPVKQAFREVYLLTPAEEKTRDYSNRFAAHILRQQQALALMKARGWTAEALTQYDRPSVQEGTSKREFARAGIRVEFFFDPAVDHSDGMDPYVASDQVRFFETASGAEVPLTRVPRLVFSEAMRDVDLFIGVSTIGADPEWTDRGAGRRFDAYWRQWGFGELGAGAEVRRAVLERLVPMLAIADRCALESRFLVVRGDLRTYKIHIGSGNILMSPNDQYLCIVAARGGAAGKVFLPFDDDRVLSMILSKAFLLAADAKITDPSITRQIGHGR